MLFWGNGICKVLWDFSKGEVLVQTPLAALHTEITFLLNAHMNGFQKYSGF